MRACNRCQGSGGFGRSIGNLLCSEWDSSSHEGQRLVSLAFQVVTGASGKKKIQSFKLACCIGDVSHNIISTTQLVKKGWSVIQSPGETYLYHEDSGTLISDVLLWGSDSVATSMQGSTTELEGWQSADGVG